MTQTILVTGGCGFIGSNFVRLLLAERPDIRIVNVDALTYAGNAENLTDVADAAGDRYVFEKVDIADAEGVEAMYERHKPDAVVHFAAESHVDRSILDSGPFVRTNVVGTQILLDAARRHDVRRHVQVSTDEVYGTLGPTGLFTEETPITPNSPYSASKAASDLLVRSYHHTFGMDVVTTRCSNNYGPYQFPEKLIPLFVSNLIDGKTVPVYGDGSNVRDWIHVEDHCRGVLAALDRGTAGEVYNFGGASEMTNLELTKALIAALDRDESAIEYVKDRPGHDLRYAIDYSKSERELDWRPRWTFKDGLAATIEWYRENTDWVSRVKSGEYRDYYERQYGGGDQARRAPEVDGT